MERERITISIKKDILSGVDKTIDGTSIRNRSHAIETLISKALGERKVDDVVILLGGDEALKLIPSVIENILVLKKLGFEKIYIAAGYLSDKIKQKIGPEEEYGLKINYIEGEGSGGAILNLKKKIKNTFIVIEPEIKIDSIATQLEIHKEQHQIATLFSNDLENFNGMYIFEPDIFKYIPSGFSMLADDIFPKLVQEKKLIVIPAL